MRGLLLFRFVSALGRGSLMSFLSIYAFSFKITAFQVGIILTTNILFLSFLLIPFFIKYSGLPETDTLEILLDYACDKKAVVGCIILCDLNRRQ